MKQPFESMAISLILLLPCLGCENVAPSRPTSDNSSTSPTTTANDNDWITSNDMIIVEKGKITEGRPKVTEDVEREIYKSLNYRRKMIASIKQNSGSSRGIQQMQDELDLLSKVFMSRYSLTQAEIDEILKKGDSNARD